MGHLLNEIRRNELLWLLAFVPVLFVAVKTQPEAHNVLLVLSVLAGTGAIFGRITGRHSWVVGIGMVIFGALLVALTIALGG